MLFRRLDPAVTPDESQREVKSKSSGKLSTSRCSTSVGSPGIRKVDHCWMYGLCFLEVELLLFLDKSEKIC